MSKEQIEEMANKPSLERQRRGEYVRRIVEAVRYKGTDDHEDVWSILCDYRDEIIAGYRKQEWISVDERLPTVEENENGLVGIVNGYNGKIRFTDAIILVDYCFEEKEWWSQDYDLTDCKVEYWMPLPEPPKMKGGVE